MTFIAL